MELNNLISIVNVISTEFQICIRNLIHRVYQTCARRHFAISRFQNQSTGFKCYYFVFKECTLMKESLKDIFIIIT